MLVITWELCSLIVRRDNPKYDHKTDMEGDVLHLWLFIAIMEERSKATSSSVGISSELQFYKLYTCIVTLNGCYVLPLKEASSSCYTTERQGINRLMIFYLCFVVKHNHKDQTLQAIFMIELES
mgnify:FL=1